ncbi:hypothetical protein CAPN008_14180 [Capnocytophaga canis]|uniref:hypothetical protein n=1 Tax=Capnocytophaga canis TaxID=1848903 RepID=UPI001AD4E226|nr:hypothetical protein [Capnocytophaga canis]GIM61368.1 hypothetical protein CAPN008_14180 [Capnocytophaga canis]
MTNDFLKELHLMGLQPSKEQVSKLQSLAVKQHRKEQCTPLFNEERWYHYIVLLMAFTRANNELCYFIEDNSVKHKLKQKFKQLKALTRDVYEEFEKFNKENKPLMNAYQSYSDDLVEMLHVHLEAINKGQ